MLVKLYSWRAKCLSQRMWAEPCWRGSQRQWRLFELLAKDYLYQL